jgi:hypothetical protein
MQRLRLTSGGRTRRAFLLAGLIPYLLLALANGGLHNHGWSRERGEPVAVSSAGSQAVCLLPAAAQSPASESECAACQWVMHSTASASTSAAIPAPAAVAAPTPPLLFHLLPAFVLTWDIRAPPSC